MRKFQLVFPTDDFKSRKLKRISAGEKYVGGKHGINDSINGYKSPLISLPCDV